jgi:sugar-specific transcriptional regulator TrmB
MADAGELSAGELAGASGLKANAAALALRALERRGLVCQQDGEPPLWKITFVGHGLAKRLRGAGAEQRRGRIARDAGD